MVKKIVFIALFAIAAFAVAGGDLSSIKRRAQDAAQATGETVMARDNGGWGS